MKHYLFKMLSLSFFLFCTFLLGISVSTSAQEFCQYAKGYQEGDQGGYDHILWKNDGNGGACMTNNSGAAFHCSWGGGVNNMLARRGHKYDGNEKHHEIGAFSATYECDFHPTNNGNAYMGVYGWTTNSKLVEFYILDNYGEYEPGGPYSEGYYEKGTFEIDGGTYKIYEKWQYDAANITGIDQTFVQYFSVRQESDKRSAGTIDITAHFEKWESLGLIMGEMYDVNLVIEAYDSEGWAEYTSASLTDNGTGGNTNGTGGTLSGIYRLRNNWANKYLAVEGNGQWADVVNAPFNADWNSEKWELVHVSGNVYRLKSLWGGHYMNGNGNGPWNDVNMASLDNSWNSLKWELEHVSGDTYRLKCLWGGYYLNGSNTNWTNVSTGPLNTGWASQEWILEATTANKDATNNEQISAIDSFNEISVYPNPASDQIRIHGITGAFTRVSIVNSVGATLKNEVISSSNSIDVSDLSTGIYIIQVECEGFTEMLKFVKK